MELDSTTMFLPGTRVMFIHPPGEPVFAQVVGHTEHGDSYHRITYDRDGKTVLHDRASVRRLCHLLPLCPACTVVVRSPRGGVGDRLPWGGERQGGGGTIAHAALCPLTLPPTFLSWLPAGITLACVRSNGDGVRATVIPASDCGQYVSIEYSRGQGMTFPPQFVPTCYAVRVLCKYSPSGRCA